MTHNFEIPCLSVPPSYICVYQFACKLTHQSICLCIVSKSIYKTTNRPSMCLFDYQSSTNNLKYYSSIRKLLREPAHHLTFQCVSLNMCHTLLGNQSINKSINMRDFRLYQRWCLGLCSFGPLWCLAGLTDSDVSNKLGSSTRLYLSTPRHSARSHRRTDPSHPSVAINYQSSNKLTYQSIHQFTPSALTPTCIQQQLSVKAPVLLSTKCSPFQRFTIPLQ